MTSNRSSKRRATARRGHYSLDCQAASLLARLVPLEHAPWAGIEALRGGWRSWSGCVLAAFVTATLVHGTWQYFSADPLVTRLDWRTEVKAWRADPPRPIEIWPHGWFLRLPPP